MKLDQLCSMTRQATHCLKLFGFLPWLTAVMMMMVMMIDDVISSPMGE